MPTHNVQRAQSPRPLASIRVAETMHRGVVTCKPDATLFTVARLRGAAAACVLLVTDEIAGEEPRRIGDEALTRGELALGDAGLAAF